MSLRNDPNFSRQDHGDAPNLSEAHPDDAGMLACLRRFHDRDAQRDSDPHPEPELDVWHHIPEQLQPMNPQRP